MHYTTAEGAIYIVVYITSVHWCTTLVPCDKFNSITSETEKCYKNVIASETEKCYQVVVTKKCQQTFSLISCYDYIQHLKLNST